MTYSYIRMFKSSRIEIEKFNGKNIDLWKLKLEDVLVDIRDQHVVVSLDATMRYMSSEYS